MQPWASFPQDSLKYSVFVCAAPVDDSVHKRCLYKISYWGHFWNTWSNFSWKEKQTVLFPAQAFPLLETLRAFISNKPGCKLTRGFTSVLLTVVQSWPVFLHHMQTNPPPLRMLTGFVFYRNAGLSSDTRPWRCMCVCAILVNRAVSVPKVEHTDCLGQAIDRAEISNYFRICFLCWGQRKHQKYLFNWIDIHLPQKVFAFCLGWIYFRLFCCTHRRTTHPSLSAHRHAALTTISSTDRLSAQLTEILMRKKKSCLE